MAFLEADYSICISRTLFPDAPEFCADYRIANARTGHIYTGKFGLTVIDLTQISLATAEDKERHLDLWASFFKTRTWKELYMLAQQDKYIDTAYGRILRLSEDEKMRQLAEARQDQIMQQNDMKYHFQQEMNALRDEKNAEIAEKDAEIAEKDAEIANIIADKNSEIAALKIEIERLKNN